MHDKERVQLCGAPPRIALCDQPRRRSIVRRRRVSCHLGVDDGLEIEVALPAAPNVDLPLVPVFSPFRGNQRIVTVGAAHPEARTT